MSHVPDVLYLSVSPALQCFNRPLLRELSKLSTISQWEYSQSPDEPCSFDKALVLLHDYLKQLEHSIHLIGHGLSGTLGLLYARRHPERVRSLTLLSVGAHPAVDWQAHYHAQRQLFKCSQTFLLTQIVNHLFGRQCTPMAKRLVAVLEDDLKTSLSPHSFCSQSHISPGGVPVPLMVGRGEHDSVIDPNALEQWQPWLKDTDVQWECSGGLHFFHYSHPVKVARQIQAFWHSLAPHSVVPSTCGCVPVGYVPRSAS